MAFGDFIRKIGKVVIPPKRIREWRQRKRQYRRSLQDSQVNPKDMRQFMKAWLKENPKPKRTKKERDQSLSEIPQIFEEGKKLFKGNGAVGQQSVTPFGGVTTKGTMLGGINPLFFLLLIPVLFPKLLKNIF